MNIAGLIIVFMMAWSSVAEACPACAVSTAQSKAWQTFWILSAMGILPIVIFAAVALIIRRMQENEKKSITGS